MTLIEAISSAGMTPPKYIVPGRWMRFPGVGKGPSNRAGWCRLITPTLAIYGDWSTNVTVTWQDTAHRDDETTKRLLAEARVRERDFARQQRERNRQAARRAHEIITAAHQTTHPYLAGKGFAEHTALVYEENLVIPMRDVRDYGRILSTQQIAPSGEKRFLAGGRTRGAVYRLGTIRPQQFVLCEGYATALSLDAALKRISGSYTVVVCFSAFNLSLVAEDFLGALVCADNDESGVGEDAAKSTGLMWCMPPVTGMDFNDLHQQKGLHAVVEVLRSAL